MYPVIKFDLVGFLALEALTFVVEAAVLYAATRGSGRLTLKEVLGLALATNMTSAIIAAPVWIASDFQLSGVDPLVSISESFFLPVLLSFAVVAVIALMLSRPDPEQSGPDGSVKVEDTPQ